MKRKIFLVFGLLIGLVIEIYLLLSEPNVQPWIDITITPTLWVIGSKTPTPFLHPRDIATLVPTMEGDCLYQSFPVGSKAPIIPECNKRMVVVGWNFLVRPFATDFENGIPLGLRYRVCSSLYCEGVGTAYAYCADPAGYNYRCTGSYLFITRIFYREAIPELGWLDSGYWGEMNRWGWYPLCVTRPGEKQICYTDWSPTPPVTTYVEKWIATK